MKTLLTPRFSFLSAPRASALFLASLGALALGAACGDGDSGDGPSGDGDSDGAGGVGVIGDGDIGGDGDLIIGGLGGAGSGGTGPVTMVPVEPITEFEQLPEGFVKADALGAWKVIGPLADVEMNTETECVNVLRAIARDLPAQHPDFEEGSTGVLPGIVETALGADRKPVLANLQGDNDRVTSEDSFHDWYNNVPGNNQPFVIDLWLEPVGDTFVFDSSTFFPLSGMGYALENGGGDGQSDGFHFTTELHTSFRFKGDEVFTFRGDDDVWVFINGKLAIDLGGVHGAEEQSVDLAVAAGELGIVAGQVYSLDLFQAERQTSASNFRIETTLDFSGCGEILETDIPEE